VDIFEQLVPTKADEHHLIRIRYYIGRANMNYIIEELDGALQDAERAKQCCQDQSQVSYETAEQVKEHTKEADSLLIKIKAKKANTSSLFEKMKGRESEAEAS